ncbi:MAG TPA: DOPA 4,5-dioxygenase family protein [Steroidobacteraceae bacterium]
MNAADPWHAHIYYDDESWNSAQRLHQELSDLLMGGTLPDLRFVGSMAETGVGPHPLPQFEIHFLASGLEQITRVLKASGLRTLIHPLTDDDLADHTTLAVWLGEPLVLDESVLDPPGHNQGIARFGKSDF